MRGKKAQREVGRQVGVRRPRPPLSSSPVCLSHAVYGSGMVVAGQEVAAKVVCPVVLKSGVSHETSQPTCLETPKAQN